MTYIAKETVKNKKISRSNLFLVFSCINVFLTPSKPRKNPRNNVCTFHLYSIGVYGGNIS